MDAEMVSHFWLCATMNVVVGLASWCKSLLTVSVIVTIFSIFSQKHCNSSVVESILKLDETLAKWWI
jgi:hypothetical protein